MDYDAEIRRLAAENMAQQYLLIGLCRGIVGLDGRNAPVVEDAFRYAESMVEIAATKFSGTGHGAHVASIAEVVEQLRAALLDDGGQPKDAV
ncbi:hypothetical protein K3181_00515 [Qipengyuania sp. YG27]|uniref:Uncharacterized protein n=1 Tax=Qipengyuania mesophila TaxID=2867246 RepID=A0ABS7JQN3_9SPHN|nr:hypothetical protein [Qipengyuania mesophila]MBX7499921.1 hypothetical protein [Qipengyuania mesophila]